MGILDFFKSKEAGEWLEVDKEAKEAFKEFKAYVDRFIEKLECFQIIILKTIDFGNWHIFEKDEARFLSSGKANMPSPKLFEMYFRLIKTNIRKIKFLVASEFEFATKEAKSLSFIHNALIKSVQGSEIIKESRVEELQSRFSLLEKNLRKQLNLISEIDSMFVRFVGDEQKWESVYEANVSERKSRPYSELVKNKKQVFSEWNQFVSLVSEYRSLLIEEGDLLIGINIGNDASQWKVNASNALAKHDLFSGLRNIIRESSNIIALSKGEKIEVFHATLNTGKIVSLSESYYAGGFFVCTENYAYAMKIIADRMNLSETESWKDKMRIIRIKMPLKVFKRLFVNDVEIGHSGDEFSEKAYEHSYFLPVSRYPEFNRYFTAGIIEVLYR